MTYEERMKWFHEARLGVYIHFGLYALLGRGEWTMYSERISPGGYVHYNHCYIYIIIDN